MFPSARLRGQLPARKRKDEQRESRRHGFHRASGSASISLPASEYENVIQNRTFGKPTQQFPLRKGTGQSSTADTCELESVGKSANAIPCATHQSRATLANALAR